MKEKIIKILKSRTNWVILVTFLVGGLEAVSGLLGAWITPVLGVLGIAAVYLKMNPSQEYGK